VCLSAQVDTLPTITADHVSAGALSMMIRPSTHMVTRVIVCVRTNVKMDGFLRTLHDFVYRTVPRTNLLTLILVDVSRSVMASCLSLPTTAQTYVYLSVLRCLTCLLTMTLILVYWCVRRDIGQVM
jgi:hypothetical protein